MAINDLIRAYSEYLDSLNIHVLRNVARRVGVYKPTDGKKDNLIDRTVSVLIGAVPPVPQSKRGAPLKDDSLDPKYMRRLAEIREEQELKNADVSYRNVTGVRSGEVVCEEEYDSPLRMGVLELQTGGSGVLRFDLCGKNAEKDAFVSAENIRRFSLREGDYVVGTVSMRGENMPVLEKVLSVNERTDYLTRGKFEEFPASYPEEKIELSAGDARLSLRLADLFCPIGKGQRALIAAPSAADASNFLREIALSVRRQIDGGRNLRLLTLLTDATPEECAEYESILCRIAVESSAGFVCTTFDRSAREHLRAARLLFARAARLAEMGEDVVLLVDSLTRLTYAANAALTASEEGRDLSCGLNTAAFVLPKSLFSTARKLQDAGSVTVLAAVSVGRDDEADRAIECEFERFANAHIVLDGGTPAQPIDLKKSGTLRAEKLLSAAEAACVRTIREGGREEEAVKCMKDTVDNAAFVAAFR